jgi:hypothetical protein
VAPPRFFSAGGDLFCDVAGRVFRVIDAAGQRWFIPETVWKAADHDRLVNELEAVFRTFEAMLGDGVPIEDARKILPSAAMTNLEFDETFGEGGPLPP